MTTSATQTRDSGSGLESDLEREELVSALGSVLVPSMSDSPIEIGARSRLLDLLEAPRGPVDRAAYAWNELTPGIKAALVSEDRARSVKKFLVWGTPGAATPRHGHTGDEVILVLEGRLGDDRASYGPGDICRSTAADVHQERVEGDTDCVCFVVYYGDWVPV